MNDECSDFTRLDREKIERLLNRLTGDDRDERGLAGKEMVGLLTPSKTNDNRMFAPWSRSEYVRRVRSFHWSWANRPQPCDVVTCARYGWIGEASLERDDEDDGGWIKCSTCEQRLYLAWDEDLASNPDTRTKIPLKA